MQTTLISDTHSQHNQLNLKGGDILIHAGDVCNRGTESEVLQFLEWFAKQNYTHKVFIAGNHDWFFEQASAEYVESIIPKGVHYLNDSGICVNGINIWGSPVQPTFYDWAFNRNRGEAINKHWQIIPHNTDILITHGPAFGILDQTQEGRHVGCDDLLLKIKEIKPKIHVFGHIHEAHGIREIDGTTFVNASVLDIRYNMTNEPIIIEYTK